MRRACIALTTILILACYREEASVSQAGSTNDPAAVRSAIEAQLARFGDAMVKGDTATMASVYTDDALVLPANMPIARGRAGINQMNAGMFSQFSVSDIKFTGVDVIVTGDYAIETGTYEMTMKPKTGVAITDVGKYVAVWQKQPDGSWKMIRDIFNSDKPPA